MFDKFLQRLNSVSRKDAHVNLTKLHLKRKKILKNRHVLPTKPKFPPTFTDNFAAKPSYNLAM